MYPAAQSPAVQLYTPAPRPNTSNVKYPSVPSQSVFSLFDTPKSIILIWGHARSNRIKHQSHAKPPAIADLNDKSSSREGPKRLRANFLRVCPGDPIDSNPSA